MTDETPAISGFLTEIGPREKSNRIHFTTKFVTINIRLCLDRFWDNTQTFPWGEHVNLGAGGRGPEHTPGPMLRDLARTAACAVSIPRTARISRHYSCCSRWHSLSADVSAAVRPQTTKWNKQEEYRHGLQSSSDLHFYSPPVLHNPKLLRLLCNFVYCSILVCATQVESRYNASDLYSGDAQFEGCPGLLNEVFHSFLDPFRQPTL